METVITKKEVYREINVIRISADCSLSRQLFLLSLRKLTELTEHNKEKEFFQNKKQHQTHKFPFLRALFRDLFSPFAYLYVSEIFGLYFEGPRSQGCLLLLYNNIRTWKLL